jgi:hypothetical protein
MLAEVLNAADSLRTTKRDTVTCTHAAMAQLMSN